MTLDEKMKALIKYFDEAITAGRRGIDTTYTAPGMAYHAAEEIGLFKDKDEADV